MKLGRKPSKEELEERYGKDGPWYLIYLFVIPIFLIAIVPEGFFTWQMMLTFAGIMSIPFIVMWWLYSNNSPKNRNKERKPFENMDLYIETLKRDRENLKQSRKEDSI